MATQNLRILALRTCKADVAVGMEQADIDRCISRFENVKTNLNSLEKDMPDWRVNGKCAIISFLDNKRV